MESELICLPAPLGCFQMPQARPVKTQFEDSEDEYLLSNSLHQGLEYCLASELSDED